MRLCSRTLLALSILFLLPTIASAAPFMNDNLVIRNAFDGDTLNNATGAASAGALGDATQEGATQFFQYVPSQAGGGQALDFDSLPLDYLRLSYQDAGITQAATSNGLTMSIFARYDGNTSQPSPAPAWLFNAGTNVGGGGSSSGIGMRINHEPSMNYPYKADAPDPGCCFGAGAVSAGPTFNHVALTVLPESGQYRAYFHYEGGALAGGNGATFNSGLFPEITSLVDGYIGAWGAAGGGEWRLDGATIDEFRLYNVGMTPAEILTLSQEVSDPGGGAVDGDYDDSGTVGQTDLDLVLLNWGDPVPPTPTNPVPWVNQIPTDGAVNQNDLDGVLLNWGNSVGAVSAVPEPASIFTAVFALSILAIRRPRG